MSSRRDLESNAHRERAEDSIAATSPEAPVVLRTRSGMFADPLVRRLGWIAGIMIVLFLATVVSALTFGVINPPAPRTALEKDLALAETKVDAGSIVPQDWFDYISALIGSEQYTKAERMIQAARDREIEDPAKQYLLVAQVRLDIARGEYEEALMSSDAAMNALEAQLKVETDRYEKTKKPTTMIADGLGENYETLRLNRAEALEALGRLDEAIVELDEYLTKNERAADILVWRGDLKATAGDADGAIADYKAASVYMPGDEALLEKLEGLGATDE
ncbi:MAG: tetratricopeptide repeat protein [Coriobacteriia bacterium]